MHTCWRSHTVHTHKRARRHAHTHTHTHTQHMPHFITMDRHWRLYLYGVLDIKMISSGILLPIWLVFPHVKPQRWRPDEPTHCKYHEAEKEALDATRVVAGDGVRENGNEAVLGAAILHNREDDQAAETDDDHQRDEVHGIQIHNVHLSITEVTILDTYTCQLNKEHFHVRASKQNHAIRLYA